MRDSVAIIGVVVPSTLHATMPPNRFNFDHGRNSMTQSNSAAGSRRALAIVLVSLATGIGCAKPLATVEGNVTFDGTPVETGSITLLSVDGSGPSAGGPIENGKYKVAGTTGVTPGEKTVRIIGIRKTGKRIEAGPPMPPGKMVDDVERYIPDIYNTKTTLSLDVVAGQVNQHDFNLESPKK